MDEYIQFNVNIKDYVTTDLTSTTRNNGFKIIGKHFRSNEANCNCNVGGKMCRRQRPYGTIGVVGLGSRDG